MTTIGEMRWAEDKNPEPETPPRYYAEAFLGTMSIRSSFSEESMENALGDLMMHMIGAFEEIEFKTEERWE